MQNRQSLNDAINQLKNIKVKKKKLIASPSKNKYQNKTMQYKYEKETIITNDSSQFITLPTSPDNEISLENEIDSSSNLSKTVNLEKLPLCSIYSSSLTNPKVIKPIITLPSENQIPKSPAQIRPPDFNNNSNNSISPNKLHESNPRFSSLQVSPPTTRNSKSSQEINKRSPPHPIKTKKRCTYHVQFDKPYKKELTKTTIELYYRFGLRLLEQNIAQKRAARYLKIAADQGHIKAIVRYATVLYDGHRAGQNKKIYTPYQIKPRSPCIMNNVGIKRNRREAARYFKMAADMGDVRSMRRYRSMLYDGDGIEKDRETAADLYKIDADNGNPDAISQYGTMLYLGDGVEKDIDQAIRYFRLAVDKRDRFGIRMMAYLYQSGIGVEYNLKKSIDLYKMAADLGDDVAVKQIVKMIDVGCKSYLTEKEIEKYCKMAADKGDNDALKVYQSFVSRKK